MINPELGAEIRDERRQIRVVIAARPSRAHDAVEDRRDAVFPPPQRELSLFFLRLGTDDREVAERSPALEVGADHAEDMPEGGIVEAEADEQRRVRDEQRPDHFTQDDVQRSMDWEAIAVDVPEIPISFPIVARGQDDTLWVVMHPVQVEHELSCGSIADQPKEVEDAESARISEIQRAASGASGREVPGRERVLKRRLEVRCDHTPKPELGKRTLEWCVRRRWLRSERLLDVCEVVGQPPCVRERLLDPFGPFKRVVRRRRFGAQLLLEFPELIAPQGVPEVEAQPGAHEQQHALLPQQRKQCAFGVGLHRRPRFSQNDDCSQDRFRRRRNRPSGQGRR